MYLISDECTNQHISISLAHVLIAKYQAVNISKYTFFMNKIILYISQ